MLVLPLGRCRQCPKPMQDEWHQFNAFSTDNPRGKQDPLTANLTAEFQGPSADAGPGGHRKFFPIKEL